MIFISHGMQGKFCLFPTDYTDLKDFFHLRFKDHWFRFNDSLFDCVKIALRMTRITSGVLYQTDVIYMVIP